MYPGPGIVDGFIYKKGYTVQLELAAECSLSKEEIDGEFRRLLAAIGASNVTTIDPYV